MAYRRRIHEQLFIWHIILLFWVVPHFLEANLHQTLTDEDEIPSESYSSFSLPIQHSFGTGTKAKFRARGSIVFKTLRSSVASFAREVELSYEEVEELKELAKKDGLYRIRAPIKIGDSFAKDDPTYVSTFVKACHLLYSGLSEKITISIDNSGNVIGLSLTTNKHECPSDFEETDREIEFRRTFNSTVRVQQQTAGTGPDTATFIKRLEEREAEKVGGKEKDNRSFFAKYWMYIVPVVLIMMLAGQQEPEQGSGGQAS